MHRRQPTNPEPIQEPIERIVTCRGPSSIVHRHHPPSPVHHPPQGILVPQEKSNKYSLQKQNLDTGTANAIISSDSSQPPTYAGPRIRRPIT